MDNATGKDEKPEGQIRSKDQSPQHSDASHSLLSDVYNWGAKQAENIQHVVSENPQASALVAGAAAVGTVALAVGSRPVKILALAAGTVGLGLGLTGCAPEEQQEAKVYKDPEDCAKDGIFTQKHCQENFDKALKEHAQDAPKFQTKQQCEDESGTECKASNDTRSVGGSHTVIYTPWMTGYMMPMSPGSSASTMLGSRPLYNSVRGEGGGRNYVTPEGSSVGSSSGSTRVPGSSFNRGSFGSRGGAGGLGGAGGAGGRGGAAGGAGGAGLG